MNNNREYRRHWRNWDVEDTNDIKIATTMMKQLDKNISLEKEKNEYKKVSDIIKEKKVNILLLELAENIDEYNERIVPNGQLTQEEFDLSKRYLNE